MNKLGVAGLFAVAAFATGPAVARAQISLVGELDPYAGNDIYADVWGEGDYAYIGTHKGTGLGIVDISDPSAPTLVTTYGAGSGTPFKDVKVHDGIGYFAGEAGGGLHIVDLADPSTPTLLAHVGAAEGGHASVHNVFVADGFAYEADSRSEIIVVLDVSDPANPFFVRDIVMPETAFIHDVTLIGTRLYASGWGGFSYIYDVANVGSVAPTLLGSVPTGAQSHSNWVSSDGSLLFSAQEISDGDIKIFDITDPAVPVLLSSVDRTDLGIDAFTPHNPVLFDDSLLFVSWYEAGVVALDVSDPSDPQLLGGYDTYPGGANDEDGNWGVYPLLGLDRVLLSDMDAGLVIVDASALVATPVPALPAGGSAIVAGALMLGAAAARSRIRPWRHR